MFRRRRRVPGSHHPQRRRGDRTADHHRKRSPSPGQDKRQPRFRSPTVQNKFRATHGGPQPLPKAPEKNVGLRPASVHPSTPVSGGTQRIGEGPQLLQKHEAPAIGGAKTIGTNAPGIGRTAPGTPTVGGGTQRIGTKGEEPPLIQKPNLSGIGGTGRIGTQRGGPQYLPHPGVDSMAPKAITLGAGAAPKLFTGGVVSATGKTGIDGRVVVDPGYVMLKSAGASSTPKVTVASSYESVKSVPGTVVSEARASKAPMIAQAPVTMDAGYDTFGEHRYSNVQPKNEGTAPVTMIQGKMKSALSTGKTGKTEILTLKPATLPSTPSTAMVEPIDSRLVTTSPPRSKGTNIPSKAIKRPSSVDRRRYQKPALIVFLIVLTAAIIGGIIYTALPSKKIGVYKGPVATFAEGYCSKVQSGISPKCILGSPPSRSCTSGVCTVMSYAVSSSYGLLWTLSDITSSTNHDNIRPVANSHPLLCRRHDDELGVCSRQGLCDRIYLGKPHRLWKSNAMWEDNCDEPNECWNNTALLKQPPKTTREACKKYDTAPWPCEPGVAAIVWMQHLRCKTGSNRTTAKPCQGLPLKLWRCAKCSRIDPSSNLCGSEKFELRDQCKYACGGKGLHNLPDGAKCNYDGNSSKKAYCYYGHCFPVESVSKERIKDMATCLADREYDEKQ